MPGQGRVLAAVAVHEICPASARQPRRAVASAFVHAGAESGARVLVSAPVGGDDMDRGTPMAAAPARRVRFLLSGVLALAVLAGGSFYLARSVFSPSQAAGRTAASPRAT